MTTKTGNAHLTVTGEALTDIVRDTILSDRPGSAYRILTYALIGERSADVVNKVLAGTHVLIGDSEKGLELVEAEDTPKNRRFLRDLHYIYAGRYRDPQYGWKRPVAHVTRLRYADSDVLADIAKISNAIGRRELIDRARARIWHYCNEGETVERVSQKAGTVGEAFVIFGPCGELPHWMTPPASPSEALEQWLSAGRTLYDRAVFDEPHVEVAGDYAVEDAAPHRDYRRLAELTEDELEDFWAKKDAAYEERCREIGEKVREQAGDDTFALQLSDGRDIIVPRAPFVCWALHRTEQRDQAPEWDTIAPSGMKMMLDDPNHTDWVLGAGLTLKEAYEDGVRDPAYDVMFKIQEAARSGKKWEPEKSRFAGVTAALKFLEDTIHSCTTIVDAGVVEGVVGEDVAVFPDSKPERVAEMVGVRAAIVEKGGMLAHFAIVSREQGVTVMRHPDACALFKEGARVTINPKIGSIVIVED